MRVENTKGNVYYGMHFYPGVAEYQSTRDDAYRIFLNENTIRNMGPSFSGRPVFVMHVDGVNSDIDVLRGEADGWVIESFYNEADGKHWAKFIAVSDRAEKAIRSGMKLSNCYVPKDFGPGGLWNGVSYQKEVLSGEYEHLAIVPNPRYEESVIMTPDEFKTYNDDMILELKRLANDKTVGDKKMSLKLFKRAKVENSLADELATTSVVLTKSGREVSILQLVNEADDAEVKRKEPKVAVGDEMVDVRNSRMTVNKLVEKHNKLCDELEAFKAKKVDEADDEDGGEPGDDGDAMPNSDDEDDKSVVKAEEEEKEVEEKKEKDKQKNSADKRSDDKKKADAEKAARLRKANSRQFEEVATVELSEDRVARGKSRYGSN